MNALSVRALEHGDREEWQRLWTAYLDFYRQPLTGGVADQSFERLCGGQLGLQGLLAMRDRRPVGFAHTLVHASTWTPTAYCYLEDLWVDPAYRGGGIGARLIEEVYTRAGDLGCARVYWHTQQFNAPARSLYDSIANPTSLVVYEHRLS